MYYVCDDMNEIPYSNHDLPWQEYRSKLFSTLFSRYTVNKGIDEIVDTPVIIRDACGNNQYIHIIAENSHSDSVSEIVKYIIEGFATGK